MLIGPEVLDWASRPAIDLRANVGRGFLLEGEGSTAQSTVRLTVLLMVIPGAPALLLCRRDLPLTERVQLCW